MNTQTNTLNKNLFQKYEREINLIKTGFLTGLATLVKIASGFVINKIVAVYIGPAGIAMIGQFQNFINIIRSFSNGALNNGIIKYIAEYHDNRTKRENVLSTAFYASLIFALITSIVLVIFKNELSLYLMKTGEYSSIFFWSGISVILFSMNGLFISVINGYKEIKRYVSVNIIANIATLILTSVLVIYMGLYGALLSFLGSQVIIFAVTILFVLNSEWFNIKTLFKGIDLENVKKLGKYSGMAITTAMIVPFSQIIVRNHITNTISIDSAGYWQGVWKISEVYLMFITTSLGIYYLPRLSEIKDKLELRKEIFSAYKILLPAVIISASTIYIFRDSIINILFSDKFMPMSELFAFQLIGDVIKIASWLLGYLMIAKAMVKHFIVTEIIFTLSFVLLCLYFVNIFGLIGTTYAFALNYLLYLIVIVWLFKDLLFLKERY